MDDLYGWFVLQVVCMLVCVMWFISVVVCWGGGYLNHCVLTCLGFVRMISAAKPFVVWSVVLCANSAIT